MSLGMEVCPGPGHMGTQLHPAPEGAEAPNFGPCLLWLNGWIDQDATWYEGRPRPRPQCVTWGSSFPHKGHSPQFLAHIYCGQTVAHLSYCAAPVQTVATKRFVLCYWTIVLSSVCDVSLLWPNGWMTRGIEVGLGPGHIVLDGDPAPPQKGAQPPPHYQLCLPQKGHSSSPTFWPMSIVAKWLDGSLSQLVWRYALAQATLC